MRIENQKDVFSEVKVLKKYYNYFKKAESIILKNEGEFVGVYFLGIPNSSFFLLYGKIYENSLLFSWIKEKNIICKISSEEFSILAKSLKKNCLGIESNEESFTFQLEEKSIIFLHRGSLLEEETLVKINSYYGSFMTVGTLSGFNNSGEILEIFLDGIKNYTLEKTEEKILELPKSRVLSYNGNNEFKLYRGLKNNKKLVGIEFENEEFSLTQISAIA